MGQAECLACHGNHRIESPADSWIGLQAGAVCAQCHGETTGGAETIRDVRQLLDRLSADVASADAVLTRAEQVGMLVDEGRLALREARDHHLHSRVLVHAFAPQPFADKAELGITAARRAHDAGDAAMRDAQVRRRGLAVATLLVLAFLGTLWLKIRRLPDVHRE
jgi:predicted CXXCH cytochrome family protein